LEAFVGCRPDRAHRFGFGRSTESPSHRHHLAKTPRPASTDAVRQRVPTVGARREDDMTAQAATYVLGHEEQELARLEFQAGMLAPATRTILRLAGIEPGMRVLDIGTGAGDVAFAVAELVGPSGSVVGVDQSVRALRFAAMRAEQRGTANVTFIHDDLHAVRIEEEFDALVGRLILMHTTDPVELLRKFAARVRPGGVVAMMDYDIRASGTLPRTDEVDRVVYWIVEAFVRSGFDPSTGPRLGSLLRAAGLAEPTVLGLQSYLEPGDPNGAKLGAETIRTLLPIIQQHGVATAAEVDVETLEERLANAVREAFFKPPTLVGGWARVGGRR
jgi:SAM-dependent methyltransferase